MLLEEIAVAPEVLALRPDFAALVLLVDGLPQGPSDEHTRALLAESAKAAIESGAANHPHVAAWREAYRAFGAKPQRFRPSVDALLRRAATGLPEVNRVVDVYNAVSVRYALPIGGEDADAYQGPARLVRAVGGEPFDTVEAGEAVNDPPLPGEVVWRDDAGVTCRRWNWRQCVRTRLTETSRRGFFVLERLEPYSLDDLMAAGEELCAQLTKLAPDARVTRRLLHGGESLPA